MRRVAARRAIAKVLLANPDGIIAEQIIPLLDKNITKNSIIDARHVSVLLRGAKGVEKESYAVKVKTYNDITYKVASYTVTDTDALKKWGNIL
jgi:hypothetical protein|tara:strand:+ start:382 stop:660 length:279 start_codon:yes stop_codon:yes gene_type:complete